jgi:hypothetical protein
MYIYVTTDSWDCRFHVVNNTVSGNWKDTVLQIAWSARKNSVRFVKHLPVRSWTISRIRRDTCIRSNNNDGTVYTTNYNIAHRKKLLLYTVFFRKETWDVRCSHGPWLPKFSRRGSHSTHMWHANNGLFTTHTHFTHFNKLRDDDSTVTLSETKIYTYVTVYYEN